MLFDSHAHLNFSAYKDDLDEVAKRTQKQGILVVNVGSKYDNSKTAVDLAKRHNGFYAAVGLHPGHTISDLVKIKADPDEGELKKESLALDEYKKLILSNPKEVMAVGEIGLDYYYKPKTAKKLGEFKTRQKEVFLKQLEIAKEFKLPVIIHCRSAHDDMIEILKQYQSLKGVIHCFTGNKEQLEKYLAMGFYIGLNGIIFKLDLNEAVKNTPLDKILVETDCPYLTPPEEGDKRNEPAFLKHIVKRIADIKNLGYDDVAKTTTENAKRFFKV